MYDKIILYIYMNRNNNNINTLTFDNHDTYVYYSNELLNSEQQVQLTPTNPDNTDIVDYESFETTLFTNGVNNGIIKLNTFDRLKLLNIFNEQVTIITMITDNGILIFNVAVLSNKKSLAIIPQIKALATYKSGKYANYIYVEIKIDIEDGYRIVTISY